jgi:hypothetical protein
MSFKSLFSLFLDLKTTLETFGLTKNLSIYFAYSAAFEVKKFRPKPENELWPTLFHPV